MAIYVNNCVIDVLVQDYADYLETGTPLANVRVNIVCSLMFGNQGSVNCSPEADDRTDLSSDRITASN